MIQTASIQSRYRIWEQVLMFLSVLLVFSSVYFYFSDVSFRRYLFPEITVEETGSTQVGKLSITTGMVRRQLAQDLDFRTVEKETLLFDQDSLVTGPDGYALVSLADGGNLELGPNTMVRLNLGSRWSLGGITRAGSVEVVTGQVTGLSAKNKIVLRSGTQQVELGKSVGRLSVAIPNADIPEAHTVVRQAKVQAQTPAVPVEVELRKISPKAGDILRADPRSQPLSRAVKMEWATSKPGVSVKLVVKKKTSPNQWKEIQSDEIAPTGMFGFYETQLNEPGTYAWELSATDTKVKVSKQVSSVFKLDPHIMVLETLPPLVSGKEIASNEYQGESLEKFNVTLRWKPFPDLKSYQVGIYREADQARPVLRKQLTGHELALRRGQILSGRFYYQVVGKLDSGFIVSTPMSEFGFKFLPPVLVKPANGTQLNMAKLSLLGGALLLTWQKTNFTTGYEVEISSQELFSNLTGSRILLEKTADNFYLWRRPPPGKYWWRVRSVSNTVRSQPSPANQIEIVP